MKFKYNIEFVLSDKTLKEVFKKTAEAGETYEQYIQCINDDFQLAIEEAIEYGSDYCEGAKRVKIKDLTSTE